MRRPRQYWTVEITRLYLQSLNPHLSGGDYYASVVAPGYVDHIRDASPDKQPDTHALVASHNMLSGSQGASCGGFYWYDIPFCPKHSYELAGRIP